MQVTVDHLDVNGETLRFAEPITAEVTFCDNQYFCQNEELGITVVSPTLESYIKEFRDEILFVWNEYGQESDDKLTSDAKALKRKILRHLKK